MRKRMNTRLLNSEIHMPKQSWLRGDYCSVQRRKIAERLRYLYWLRGGRAEKRWAGLNELEE